MLVETGGQGAHAVAAKDDSGRRGAVLACLGTCSVPVLKGGGAQSMISQGSLTVDCRQRPGDGSRPLVAYRPSMHRTDMRSMEGLGG